MTPVDFRKLEHSHRFCLKHMQGLPRRTATNFTLSAINAVPMETVIDHKINWTFLDNCVTFHAHIWLNVSSTSGSHISNTWRTRALVSPKILTEYWPSMLYTIYLIDIYQMECFPLSVHGKKSFMKRLSNEVTVNIFHEYVKNYPTCAPLVLRSDGVSCIWTMTRHWQELSSICRRKISIIGRVVMPKYRNTCSLCNRVSSDLVQYRILFCNAIDDCRKKLWETIIKKLLNIAKFIKDAYVLRDNSLVS